MTEEASGAVAEAQQCRRLEQRAAPAGRVPSGPHVAEIQIVVVSCQDLNPSGAGCAEVGLQGEVALYGPKDGKRKTFAFDKAFGEGSDQVSVYEDTKALIRSVLDGAPHRALSILHASSLEVMRGPRLLSHRCARCWPQLCIGKQ